MNRRNIFHKLIGISICALSMAHTIAAMGGGAETECGKDLLPQWAKLERNEPSYRGTISDSAAKIPVINIAFSVAAAPGKTVSNAKTTLSGIKSPTDHSNNMIDLAHVQLLEIIERRFTNPMDNADYVLVKCTLHDGSTQAAQLLFPYNTVICASQIPSTEDHAGEIAHPFLNKAWFLRDIITVEIAGLATSLPEKH